MPDNSDHRDHILAESIILNHRSALFLMAPLPSGRQRLVSMRLWGYCLSMVPSL
jgi:hypothetical protein